MLVSKIKPCMSKYERRPRRRKSAASSSPRRESWGGGRGVRRNRGRLNKSVIGPCGRERGAGDEAPSSSRTSSHRNPRSTRTWITVVILELIHERTTNERGRARGGPFRRTTTTDRGGRAPSPPAERERAEREREGGGRSPAGNRRVPARGDTATARIAPRAFPPLRPSAAGPRRARPRRNDASHTGRTANARAGRRRTARGGKRIRKEARRRAARISAPSTFDGRASACRGDHG